MIQKDLPTGASPNRMLPRALSRLFESRATCRPKMFDHFLGFVATVHSPKIDLGENKADVLGCRYDGDYKHCPRCQEVFYHPLGMALQNAGLCGPQLTALFGFLKGACHTSFSAVRKFFRDVMAVPISRGQLAKLVQKVSAGLQPACDDLLTRLPDEDVLNVDETGHKDLG
jgi:hypothetical protein